MIIDTWNKTVRPMPGRGVYVGISKSYCIALKVSDQSMFNALSVPNLIPCVLPSFLATLVDTLVISVVDEQWSRPFNRML